MAGIEESKEVLELVNSLVLAVVKRVKDGFQIEDIIKVITEDIDIEKLKAAVGNITQVPVEITDLDFNEISTLVGIEMKFVVELLKALGVIKA